MATAVMNDQDEVLVIIHEYFLPHARLGTWKTKQHDGATKTLVGVWVETLDFFFGWGGGGFTMLESKTSP